MEFLKRHYEKFILLGLFVLFVVLMLIVLSIVQQTGAVTERDLKLKKSVANYEMQDPASDIFKTALLWKNSAFDWEKSGARDQGKGNGDFSDLVSVFEIAKCPFCSQAAAENTQGQVLIPRGFFEKKCPFCNKNLPKPTKNSTVRRTLVTKDDSDGDGISNADEEKYKLDPENPDDALYDADNDGFSNYFEISRNFRPNDRYNHPPFWHRLRLTDIRQIPLDIKVTNIKYEINGKLAAKKLWQLQYNLYGIAAKKGRKTENTYFASIGDKITIEGRRYEITDIERIIEDGVVSEHTEDQGKKEEQEKKSVARIDKSRVSLVEVMDSRSTGRVRREPDKLVMVVGQPVYSSDKRPVLEDTGYPDGKKTYTLKIGDSFTMGVTKGRRRTAGKDFVSYTVVAADAEKMTVTLHDNSAKDADANAKPLIVTRKGMIPDDSLVIEEKQRENGPAREIGPGPVDAPTIRPASGRRSRR